MDPVTLIVAALAQGALAIQNPGVARAVKKAYAALKKRIRREYGDRMDVTPLERDSVCPAEYGALEEDFRRAGAGSDAALVKQARRLLELIRSRAPGTIATIGVDLGVFEPDTLDIKEAESSEVSVHVPTSAILGKVEIPSMPEEEVRPDPEPRNESASRPPEPESVPPTSAPTSEAPSGPPQPAPVDRAHLGFDKSHRDPGAPRKKEESPPPGADAPARVLNSSFAEPDTGHELDPREALAAGREYDLWVDVGPPRAGSLVTGPGTFPEASLPPAETGWTIQVALVSEHFEPRVATGEIFVPRGGGRSFPVVDGVRADQAGPLALRVRAPAGRRPPREATARLCLYFRKTLLQSAAVRVGVRSEPDVRLDRPNPVDVDFVLTGTWDDVEGYATRAVRLPGRPEGAAPVLASFTLNGDGDGGHRIILKDREELPPAWAPYDPGDAARTLADVRARLLECFHLRDEATYQVLHDGGVPRNGLNPNNGKSKKQFKMDLYRLAEAGGRLYNTVSASLRPEGMDALEWDLKLRELAASAGVISVARTGAANYVLPWALMYEYPLFEVDVSRLRFCRVLDEWGDDGVRAAGADPGACPHAAEPDHAENVVCPYGFWGLKHIVEQPLAAVDPDAPPGGDGASRSVVCGSEVDLAVGVTHELGPDGQAVRDRHLQRLAALPGVRCATPPADDWEGVCRILAQPEVAYFLCHGEYDEATGEPYLGVGPRDGNPEHRVYPNHLLAYLRGGDVARGWRERRPLVFVNGCHTFELEPGRMLNLVAAFGYGRASGVVGTEVSVQLPLAVEVADSLLARFVGGTPLGEALRAVRWELANKGSLLGLAYTMYALADLKVGVQPA